MRSIYNISNALLGRDNQLHFNINIKSDNTKVRQCRRGFRRGNYEEIRTSLALIDWNDKMNNNTATECWNMLRWELDSAIDSYVPMKKRGKRYKKKHLSKEAFRKIRYTIVPVMNGHPRDQAKVSVHCRWPLVTGTDGQAGYAKYNTPCNTT